MIQPMPLSTIAALCQGRVYGEDVAVSSVEIDSRRSRGQSLFVALPGIGRAYCGARVLWGGAGSCA